MFSKFLGSKKESGKYSQEISSLVKYPNNFADTTLSMTAPKSPSGFADNTLVKLTNNSASQENVDLIIEAGYKQVFGNIGLMEFAYSSVLVLFAYEPALGLSVAILMRMKSLLDGAMGGLLAPIFVTQKSE